MSSQMVSIGLRSGEQGGHSITLNSAALSTDFVKAEACPLALSCWNCSSGYCCRISSTTGIMIPQYDPSFIVSQSFSQNKPLCLPYFPLIDPQNIHPIFLWCRGCTQSRCSFSLSLQVIQIRVCLPGCAQVSSLHRTSS